MYYRFARFVVLLFLRLFNSWVIEGGENLPANGPAVLVANHVSLWDPPVLGCSVKRKVHFMAKEELFQIPVIGRIFPLLECFPIKRGKMDRNALRIAAQYLEKGEVLGIFPEGTRNREKSGLLPFQPGAALFAIRSGVPIIPIGLIGTRTSFPLTLRGRLRVRIGKPLVYPEMYGQKLSHEELERVSGELAEQISILINVRNND